MALPVPALGAAPAVHPTVSRMTFTESISTGLSRLSDFSGRAGRSEYWWFSLFLVLALALLVGAIVLLSSLTGAPVSYGAMAVLLVPLYLALMAAQVRRLRDAGLGRWWIVLNLVPYVGAPLVLALMLLPTRQEGSESTGPGSLSSLSLLMVTGWGAMSGNGGLQGDTPPSRRWLPLAGVVLVAAAIAVVVYIVYKDWRHGASQPAPVAVSTVAAPAQGVATLTLLDEGAGMRLYYDAASARLTGPDTLSVQLVFDWAQPREREGISYRSMKQNEVFQCAARTSSWTTRFYLSEALGEGAAVLIEDGKGSLMDMSEGELGNQRLAAVCSLLPALRAPAPAPAPGR
jgi:uncharacterized membrane protein YhaH (DUF805 family)